MKINEEIQEEGKIVQITTRGVDPAAEQRTTMQQLRKAMDETPWKDIIIHPLGSEMSQQTYDYLFANEDVKDITEVSNSYLDLISSIQIKQHNASKDGETKGSLDSTVPLTQLSDYSLSIRIRAIIISAQAVSLSTLMRITKHEFSEEEIISAALESCVIIRGVFICKSQLMYTDRPLYARDYLLKLFLDSEHVSRQDFIKETKLLPDMAANMLREIAVLEPRGWKLKVDYDPSIKQM